MAQAQTQSNDGSTPRVLLGIDLGSRYIGLALYRHATGLNRLDPYEFKNEFLFADFLKTLVDEYSVNQIVVGDMGLPALPAPYANAIKRVTQNTPVSYIIVSERLTTFQVERELKNPGERLHHRAGHSESALELLRDYLMKEKIDAQ